MELINQIRGRFTRITLAALMLGALSLSVAACGGPDATATPPASSVGNAGAVVSDVTPTPAASGATGGTTDAQQVNAALSEWAIAFDPKDIKAGKVKFIVSNTGKFGHDLVVQDSSGGTVGSTPSFKNADGTKELEVDLKPGTYKVVCDIPGHADKGMKTEIVVK